MDDGLHGALRGVAVQDHAVSLLRLQVDLFLFLLRGESWRNGNKGGIRDKGHKPISARTHTEKCHQRNDFTYCAVEISTLVVFQYFARKKKKT